MGYPRWDLPFAAGLVVHILIYGKAQTSLQLVVVG